jgi:DNA-directed RNA polymerase alpha subunit
VRICPVCGAHLNEVVAEKLGTPIAKLNLSTRAKNCLRRGGIETIEELLKLERHRFLNMRNMGEKTASEIAQSIIRFGFNYDILK